MIKSVLDYSAIIYDPLSWIDQSHITLPSRFNNTRCTRVINDILIDHFNLSTNTYNVSADSLASAFIHYWFNLPQIAFLMTCQRHRAQLALNGKIARLPSSVQRFMQLDLVSSGAALWSKKLNIVDLYSRSFYELQPLLVALPVELAERVPLLFPKDKSDRYQSDLSTDLLIFKLAIQHVKIHPFRTTKLCA